MTVKLANAHDADCICVPCMMADLDATIVANGGEDALDRINGEMTLIGGGKVEAQRTRFLKPGQGAGHGKRGTRKISDKQKRFVISLIQSRDISKIRTYPGQTLVIERVGDMGVPAAKALIEELLNAPVVAVRMASEGQKRFIASLNSQIQDERCRITQDDIDSITFAEVNDTLALLKRIIAGEREDNARNSGKNVSSAKKSVTPGAYWHTDANGLKLIARVQKTKNGKRMYAKIQYKPGSDRFDYEPGLIGKLNADNMLTVSEMQQFAQQYSQCADCGTKITNPMSIARGIGPVCSGKGYREI